MGTRADTACGGAPGRACWPPRPQPPEARPALATPRPHAGGDTTAVTDQQIHRDLTSEALGGQQEWGSGPLALPPSQGHSPQTGCAPSFLCAPLCHHGKPQRGPVHSRSAPRASGPPGRAGQWVEGHQAGVRVPHAAHSVGSLGPRLWRTGASEGRKSECDTWGPADCGHIGPDLGGPGFKPCCPAWSHDLGQAPCLSEPQLPHL